MSELLSPQSDQSFIGVKLTDVGRLLDKLENESPTKVQEGVEQIIIDSYTSAVESVPDLGFGMRAIALGARRELAGLYRSLDNVYIDIEMRVGDEMLRGQLWRLISGQEQFIAEYKSRRSDKDRMRSLRQDYMRDLRTYGSNFDVIAKERAEKRAAAILLGGLAVGLAPVNVRDDEKNGMLRALAS